MDWETVHVWRHDLDVSPTRRAQLRAHLSTAERDQAQRLRRPLARRRWTAARGGLRELLARCTGMAPERIEFNAGPHGKPMLSAPGAADLRFSVSHSHAIALYAIACGSEVGVDVEHIRDDFPIDEVSARFFTVAERREVADATGPERVAAFYRCWTRKEAALKLSGVGLRGIGDGSQPAPSHLWSLEVALGYAAAVAVDGGNNSAPVLHVLMPESEAIDPLPAQPLPLVAAPIR